MRTLHCRPDGAPPSEIRLGLGIAGQLGAWTGGRRVFALVDGAMFDHDAVPAAWHAHRARRGEEQKTLAACEVVLRAMAAAAIDRGDLMVAFGGGAVGDAGGLCASLYLRGIELWQVPTTLLAMVDSGVGGKTAVNLPEGKNLVGTVHPAQLVVIDVDFAASLGEREFQSGLAEAVKMAIGLDRELFVLLERERDRILGRDPAALLEVIERALAAKIAVVEGDLRESGRRRLLNLGHTLGHALEAVAMGSSPHGLCVAQGLHFALELAGDLDAISSVDRNRCRELLAAYGFRREQWPAGDELMRFLARDKKVVGETVQFALPTGIGQSRVAPLDLGEIRHRLDA